MTLTIIGCTSLLIALVMVLYELILPNRKKKIRYRERKCPRCGRAHPEGWRCTRFCGSRIRDCTNCTIQSTCSKEECSFTPTLDYTLGVNNYYG